MSLELIVFAALAIVWILVASLAIVKCEQLDSVIDEFLEECKKLDQVASIGRNLVRFEQQLRDLQKRLAEIEATLDDDGEDWKFGAP